MKKLKPTTTTDGEASSSSSSTASNPFDALSDEILFAILDRLDGDPPATRAFSAACRAFHSAESRHRRRLRPLRAALLPRAARRYPLVSRLDLTLCPLVDDAALAAAASAWGRTLRAIDLSRSRSFSASGIAALAAACRSLTEVDLSNAVGLTDSAAHALAAASGLERLRLARCKSLTDIGIGCIAVGCKNLKFVCLRWCLKITDLGVDLIAVKCKEIRSLDLSYLPITEKCLTSILQLPHLEDLVLEGCYGIDDNGLATLSHSCHSLKMLSMSNCQNISHLGMFSLTNGAESLEQLILTNGPSVSTDLAKCLGHFSQLRSIRLDGCVVTSSGINAIGNWNASLFELSLSKCSGLTDESLSFLAQRHKQLRKLDITCCRKLTYASIYGVTSSCTYLTSLRMESCSLVSKDAFVLIGQRCQLLEELDVTDNEINDEGLKAISSCSRLRSLKLGVCLNITDEGLIHVGNGCSKIKELDLYRCSGVTDTGIAAVALGSPALETINIAYNSKITDSSLRSLSQCSALKVLEIRGCPRVSSAGLSDIAMGCRQLTVLDIKKCCDIDDKAMHPLAKFSQNLEQINLSYCSVTDVGLVSVTRISRLRNMTILHLSGLTPNGLAAALLTCVGLTKVKLHRSFRPLLSEHIFKHMEARGCVFHWRDKAFQVEIDPKGRQLELERRNEAP